MSNIGINIKTIRKSLKLTQEELASRAGYKNSAIIVSIENDNKEPSYEKVKDLANALGVSIYQIVGQNSFRKVDGKGIYYNAEERIALDLFAPLISEMDEDELEKLLDYAILLLHAASKQPKWKKTKYQQDNTSVENNSELNFSDENW